MATGPTVFGQGVGKQLWAADGMSKVFSKKINCKYCRHDCRVFRGVPTSDILLNNGCVKPVSRERLQLQPDLLDL